MSLLMQRKPPSDIPLLDGGTYMGVCVGVIDLGEQYVQYEKQIQGKYVEQAIFIFEIPSERVQVNGEDKPRWLSSKKMALSLDERSNMYKMLVSWRGKPFSETELNPKGGFHIGQMLGLPAMLSVSVGEGKDGRLHNAIESLTGFPKGIEAPKAESELLKFDADEPDFTVLEKLPEWVRNVIKKSTQFAENPPDEKIEAPEMQSEPEQQPEDGEECPI